MQTERQMAANPQTSQLTWAVCECGSRLLPSTSTIAIYYYYSARKLILILLSHGRQRLYIAVAVVIKHNCPWCRVSAG